MIKKSLIACALILSALVAGHGYKVKAGAPPLISGIWTGTIQSISPFQRPFFNSNQGTTPTDDINVTVPTSNVCGGGPPCTISTATQVVSFILGNDETLAKGNETTGITLNLAVSKTTVTGTVTGPDNMSGTIDGVVLTANRFFLLHVSVNGDPGPCPTQQFQGSASIVPSATGQLIFTGSGIDHDCRQQFVSGIFTKS